MSDTLAVKSFRLKNFKAIRDSGVVKFTPLTVLIGGNGSGKSSLIEGLLTYQQIISAGLDNAMNQWRGFEYITDPPITFGAGLESDQRKIEPITFTLTGTANEAAFRSTMMVAMTPNGDQVFIQQESVHLRGKKFLERDQTGVTMAASQEFLPNALPPGASVLAPAYVISAFGKATGSPHRGDMIMLSTGVMQWQFVTLDPYTMGQPKAQSRSGGEIRLAADGSNIAEYLLDIQRRNPLAFDGIVETLKEILPYARDLQPTLTSQLERAVYLQLTEEEVKIPGWLLSSGTLRILALLALLRHPEPPPLILIEELENGLDPRTMHLLVEEIRYAVESGRTQIIITTHSPYLLDILSLQHIVLVERVDRAPVFYRPANEADLSEWSHRFGPGQLYTMGKLRRESQG